jgi:hypothetical protein
VRKEEKQREVTIAEEVEEELECQSRSCAGSFDGKRPKAKWIHEVRFDDALDEEDTVEYEVCKACDNISKKKSQGGKLLQRRPYVKPLPRNDDNDKDSSRWSSSSEPIPEIMQDAQEFYDPSAQEVSDTIDKELELEDVRQTSRRSSSFEPILEKPTPPSIPPPIQKPKPDMSPKTETPPKREFTEKSYTRNVYIDKKTATHLNIGLKTLDTQENHNVDALLDCGATAMFIDEDYTRKLKLSTRKLD